MIAPGSSGRAVLRRELAGKPLFAVRCAVVLYATLAVIAYVRWLPRWIDLRLDTAISTVAVGATSLPLVQVTWLSIIVAIASTTVWCAVALLIELRRSRDLFGNILFASLVSFAVIVATDVDVILPMQRSDSLPQFQMPLLFVANALSLPWMYVFPDGRVVPNWAWIPASIWSAWSILRIVSPGFDQASIGTPAILLNVVLVLTGVSSLVFRYLRRADVVQKDQLRWFLVGALFALLAYVLTLPVSALIPEIELPGAGYLYRTLVSSFLSASLIVVPLTLAAAIFRQGLLDIELVFNRTIAFSLMTGLLVAGFVLISRALDRIAEGVTGTSSVVVPIVTAIGLAVAFLPLRTALLRVADRFMSGQRILTVLFVDIVGSTELAVRIGDRAWGELLERFRRLVRREIKRYGGVEVDTAGDGFFVTFDGPGRGIRCARSALEAVKPLGIECRAGMNIGEVEIHHDRVTGVAVHVGSRLMALAKPNEVLVSAALREVVAGSNIELLDRGEHVLRGLPGVTRLYEVAASP